MDISVSLFQIVMGLAVYLVIAAVLIAVSVIDFRTRRARDLYRHVPASFCGKNKKEKDRSLSFCGKLITLPF